MAGVETYRGRGFAYILKPFDKSNGKREACGHSLRSLWKTKYYHI
ncbi:hypothetical protein M2480_000365 [Parabacteroides sp. PFB2-12]|nr:MULTISPECIES: hypothetical protein [unclassified Parabacteroides]MDH6341215.1 hypothetical protein [Parabacteroides sp. PM6-13]MDH6389405.1 hypothetical protein [Parabacteroides sp. PFB2-12]